MLQIIQILFIVLLVAVLFMLYKGERAFRKAILPRAKVEEYWNGRERRRHIRFQKSIDVTYMVEKRPHLNSNGRTLDISEGGMKLLLYEKLANGTVLNLGMELPSSKIAQVEGEVVWSEEPENSDSSDRRAFHCGIRFNAIKEPSGESLIAYIRSLAQET